MTASLGAGPGFNRPGDILIAVIGDGPNQLSNPNSSVLLANGHSLIADENNNRVIEVNRDHKIVWQYGHQSDPSIINGAAFASRLANGDALITGYGQPTDPPGQP